MKFVGFVFSFLAILTPTMGQAAQYHHSSSDPYDLLEEVDYVIVGAGTSGCPLAAKLASQKKHGQYKNENFICGMRKVYTIGNGISTAKLG